MFQIEKGIPAPNKPSPGGSGGIAYPFAELEVGDSFVVDLNGGTTWAGYYEAVKRAQQKHNIKITSRLIQPGKRRVWRVA